MPQEKSLYEQVGEIGDAEAFAKALNRLDIDEKFAGSDEGERIASLWDRLGKVDVEEEREAIELYEAMTGEPATENLPELIETIQKARIADRPWDEFTKVVGTPQQFAEAMELNEEDPRLLRLMNALLVHVKTGNKDAKKYFQEYNIIEGALLAKEELAFVRDEIKMKDLLERLGSEDQEIRGSAEEQLRKLEAARSISQEVEAALKPAFDKLEEVRNVERIAKLWNTYDGVRTIARIELNDDTLPKKKRKKWQYQDQPLLAYFIEKGLPAALQLEAEIEAEKTAFLKEAKELVTDQVRWDAHMDALMQSKQSDMLEHGQGGVFNLEYREKAKYQRWAKMADDPTLREGRNEIVPLDEPDAHEIQSDLQRKGIAHDEESWQEFVTKRQNRALEKGWSGVFDIGRDSEKKRLDDWLLRR